MGAENTAVSDVSTKEANKTVANPHEQPPLEQQQGTRPSDASPAGKFEAQLPSRITPVAGQSDQSAISARIAQDKSVGISPGTQVKIGDQTGMMFTNGDGSTFKTADGKSYTVTANPDQTYNLKSTGGDNATINNAKLERVKDPINGRPDAPAPLTQPDATKRQTDTPPTKLDIAGADTPPQARLDNARQSSDEQGRNQVNQPNQLNGGDAVGSGTTPKPASSDAAAGAIPPPKPAQSDTPVQTPSSQTMKPVEAQPGPVISPVTRAADAGRVGGDANAGALANPGNANQARPVDANSGTVADTGKRVTGTDAAPPAAATPVVPPTRDLPTGGRDGDKSGTLDKTQTPTQTAQQAQSPLGAPSSQPRPTSDAIGPAQSAQPAAPGKEVTPPPVRDTNAGQQPVVGNANLGNANQVKPVEAGSGTVADTGKRVTGTDAAPPAVATPVVPPSRDLPTGGRDSDKSGTLDKTQTPTQTAQQAQSPLGAPTAQPRPTSDATGPAQSAQPAAPGKDVTPPAVRDTNAGQQPVVGNANLGNANQVKPVDSGSGTVADTGKKVTGTDAAPPAVATPVVPPSRDLPTGGRDVDKSGTLDKTQTPTQTAQQAQSPLGAPTAQPRPTSDATGPAQSAQPAAPGKDVTPPAVRDTNAGQQPVVGNANLGNANQVKPVDSGSGTVADTGKKVTGTDVAPPAVATPVVPPSRDLPTGGRDGDKSGTLDKTQTPTQTAQQAQSPLGAPTAQPRPTSDATGPAQSAQPAAPGKDVTPPLVRDTNAGQQPVVGNANLGNANQVKPVDSGSGTVADTGKKVTGTDAAPPPVVAPVVPPSRDLPTGGRDGDKSGTLDKTQTPTQTAQQAQSPLGAPTAQPRPTSDATGPAQSAQPAAPGKELTPPAVRDTNAGQQPVVGNANLGNANQVKPIDSGSGTATDTGKKVTGTDAAPPPVVAPVVPPSRELPTGGRDGDKSGTLDKTQTPTQTAQQAQSPLGAPTAQPRPTSDATGPAQSAQPGAGAVDNAGGVLRRPPTGSEQGTAVPTPPPTGKDSPLPAVPPTGTRPDVPVNPQLPGTGANDATGGTQRRGNTGTDLGTVGDPKQQKPVTDTGNVTAPITPPSPGRDSSSSTSSKDGGTLDKTQSGQIQPPGQISQTTQPAPPPGAPARVGDPATGTGKTLEPVVSNPGKGMPDNTATQSNAPADNSTGGIKKPGTGGLTGAGTGTEVATGQPQTPTQTAAQAAGQTIESGATAVKRGPGTGDQTLDKTVQPGTIQQPGQIQAPGQQAPITSDQGKPVLDANGKPIVPPSATNPDGSPRRAGDNLGGTSQAPVQDNSGIKTTKPTDTQTSSTQTGPDGRPLQQKPSDNSSLQNPAGTTPIDQSTTKKSGDPSAGVVQASPSPVDGTKTPGTRSDGTLDKGSTDKTQTPNPNAPTPISTAPNPNAPMPDKTGDPGSPGKVRGLDPSAPDAPRQPGSMGAATGAKGSGDGSGTLDKQAQDGQAKPLPADAAKDARDANLAKLLDSAKNINPQDPQSQAMIDWQNMRQQWLQNRAAMQQAMLANALNPNGLPGTTEMDQRRAQWLANRQAMLEMAGLNGLSPDGMTREQRMLQINLNRQAMADGVAAGALDPMQLRAMMIQQWLLQRQMLLDQQSGINSPDFIAMRQQWLQNQLMMRNQMDSNQQMMQQDMMRQMMLQRMAEFLRNQTTTDQLAMGLSGRMYQELNRIRDNANQHEAAGRVPLAELINRRLENQTTNQLTSNVNLNPPSRLDSVLPSRADMQNLNNQNLANQLANRQNIEPVRPVARPEMSTRLENAGRDHRDQNDNIQNSVRRAAENVIETAAGAKAAQDAARRIENRIDNVILGIRQNEIENLSTQQSAAKGRTSEVANVANNSTNDAALLAAITAKKLKEEKDLKERLLQAEKAKKKDDGKRRKIVVKEKETLEIISKKYLRDVRLVPLIYEINAHILQAKARVKKSGEVQLVAGTILWLPSSSEIETFRAKLMTGGSTSQIRSGDKPLTAEDELSQRFGDNWDGRSGHSTSGLEEISERLGQSAQDANMIRRQNIEAVLGPIADQGDDSSIYYTCRLGDTLKSIAVKHPALKDPSLWKLIAEINNMTTAVDSKGVPLAKVVRGAKLRLPNPDEVTEYLSEKRRVSQMKADEFSSPTGNFGSATTVVDPEAPAERKINSLKDAGALMLQAGGFKSKTNPISEAVTDGLTPTTPPTVYLSATEFERTQASLLENSKAIENVRALSDDCRIVRRHLAHFDGTRSFQAQLDVMVNGSWKVALVYNVADNESWCQRFSQDGKVEKVKIQLPTSAIHQMLENDVNSNWQSYRDQMLG